MDQIRYGLKVAIPRYLKNMPLPRTFSGFLKLSQKDWMNLAPFIMTVFLILYTMFAGGSKKKEKLINETIKKTESKVVDKICLKDIEDSFKDGKDPCSMCRCWKSKKFPYCDGSHVKHNKLNGDNVGPLLITK